MEYTAKSQNLSFEIKKENQVLGKINYGNWFKLNAEIEISGKKFQVEPKGFFKSGIEIKEGSKVLVTIEMKWNGDVIIKTKFNNNEEFTVRHSGFFKEKFTMRNHKNEENLVLNTIYHWKAMIYTYQIKSTENFEMLENRDLLIFSAVHAANYYMWLSGSV